jgi:hypothetical protein
MDSKQIVILLGLSVGFNLGLVLLCSLVLKEWFDSVEFYEQERWGLRYRESETKTPPPPPSP